MTLFCQSFKPLHSFKHDDPPFDSTHLKVSLQPVSRSASLFSSAIMQRNSWWKRLCPSSALVSRVAVISVLKVTFRSRYPLPSSILLMISRTSTSVGLRPALRIAFCHTSQSIPLVGSFSGVFVQTNCCLFVVSFFRFLFDPVELFHPIVKSEDCLACQTVKLGLSNSGNILRRPTFETLCSVVCQVSGVRCQVSISPAVMSS